MTKAEVGVLRPTLAGFVPRPLKNKSRERKNGRKDGPTNQRTTPLFVVKLCGGPRGPYAARTDTAVRTAVTSAPPPHNTKWSDLFGNAIAGVLAGSTPDKPQGIKGTTPPRRRWLLLIFKRALVIGPSNTWPRHHPPPPDLC